MYTSVNEVNGKIYHRYIKDGKDHAEVVSEFPQKLYVFDECGTHRDLMGNPLREITYQKIADFKNEFTRGGKKVYGQNNPVQQFLTYTYADIPSMEGATWKILYWDIETYFDSGFVEPSEATGPITSINFTVVGGGDETSYTLGLKRCTLQYDNHVYIHCHSEVQLIEKFISMWSEHNPHFHGQYNGDLFDLPYLITRSLKLGISQAKLNKLSPFHKQSNANLTPQRRSSEYTFEVIGVPSLDFLQLYKKFSRHKHESYRLDFIANFELGEAKVSYDDYNNDLVNLYDGHYKFTIPQHEVTQHSNERRWCNLRTRVMRHLNTNTYPALSERPLLDDALLPRFETLVFDKLDQLTSKQALTLLEDLHNKVHQDSYNLFVRYNIVDTQLLVRLDKRLAFSRLALSFAHISNSNVVDVYGTVKPWENMVYAFLHRKGIVIPQSKKNESSEFVGGYVKDVTAGRHGFVASFDFKSLYPSIIRMLSLSPENLTNGRPNGDIQAMIQNAVNLRIDNEVAKMRNETIAVNGTRYKKTLGIIPEIMTFLFNERDSEKSKMKALQKEQEKLKAKGQYSLELEAQIASKSSSESALKILANGGYGAISNDGFRYFEMAIAEAITSTGQAAAQYAIKNINEYLTKLTGVDADYVVCSDTDSVYLSLDSVLDKLCDEVTEVGKLEWLNTFIETDLSVFIDDLFNRFAKHLNADQNLLFMKREAIANAMMIRKKKNYIITLLDNEGVRFETPKLKMVGIEAVKSNTPLMIRESLEVCLKHLIKGDHAAMREYVNEFEKRYKREHYSKIAKPTGVSDMDKYAQSDIRIPIHVKAAQTYNALIASNPQYQRNFDIIKNGTKIKFLKLKTPNPFNSHVMGFIDSLPSDIEIEKYIDYDEMYEQTFLSPLESFTVMDGFDMRYNALDLFDVGNVQIKPQVKRVTKATKVASKPQAQPLDLF